MDIADSRLIAAMFESIGNSNVVARIAGKTRLAVFDSMTEEDFNIGLKSKLTGQINLVRIGNDYVHEGGSFTLSTKILADHPAAFTTSTAMVNNAINSFVKAVFVELKNGIRIDVGAPGLVEDAVEKCETYFPGHKPILM